MRSIVIGAVIGTGAAVAAAVGLTFETLRKLDA